VLLPLRLLYFYADRPSWTIGDLDLITKIVRWGEEDLREGNSLDELFKVVEEKHPSLVLRVQRMLESK
jgi:hypothetical protein